MNISLHSPEAGIKVPQSLGSIDSEVVDSAGRISKLRMIDATLTRKVAEAKILISLDRRLGSLLTRTGSVPT